MEEEYLKLKRSNEKKKAIIIVLLFLVIALVMLLVFICCGKKVTTPKEEYVNTFKYDGSGSYGVAYATGYTVVKEVTCDDGMDCVEGEKYNEVLFYVTSTDSEDLKKEINSWYGEGYEGNKSISLGCYNNVVAYFNAADTFLTSEGDLIKSFTLSEEETTKIISSTVNHPITLRLEKYKLTNGTGAPMCYSNFSKIEVAK